MKLYAKQANYQGVTTVDIKGYTHTLNYVDIHVAIFAKQSL